MDSDFEIRTGDDGIPFQTFNGKTFKLYKGEKYFSRHIWRMHTEVWKHFNGEIPKGFHVHHIDENKLNNKISNLELKPCGEHLSSHMSQRVKSKPEWFKEFQKKGIAVAPEWHKSKDGYEWHKQHAIKCGFGHKTIGKAPCIVCGKEFERIRPNNNKCSNKCRAKYRRDMGLDNIERQCAGCGKPFIVNRFYKSKCCSKVCGGVYKRNKNRLKRSV